MDVWDLDELRVEPHHPVVLHSDEGAARVVALSLPAGEELQEHEVHEHTWMTVQRGSVRVGTAAGDEDVRPGTLVHWRPQERRTVTGVEDALVLLLLAPWPGPGHPTLLARAGTGAEDPGSG
jgi:quercetin dioxygenase-like cupin family protein